MKKEIALFLSTTPYSSENFHTIIGLAESALRKGNGVRLIASSDGVFSIVKGQVPQAVKVIEDLMDKGMKVDI